ncbi:hypothetical protein [Umezawaea sp. NPDC059074]|uniref:hypothetical protein n=1 Tax=Umezawaea sp. NPDC059074 TaxID=3346716 RepID=UPI0036BDF4A5
MTARTTSPPILLSLVVALIGVSGPPGVAVTQESTTDRFDELSREDVLTARQDLADKRAALDDATAAADRSSRRPTTRPTGPGPSRPDCAPRSTTSWRSPSRGCGSTAWPPSSAATRRRSSSTRP